MQGARLVVLVPDAATQHAVRSIASCYPVADLQAAVSVVQGPIEACVRETRRTLFEGPLAVLTWSEGCALRALAAGADEAFALASVALDGDTWMNLAERARVKAALRREAQPRLAALRELEKLCALGRLVSGIAEELSDPLNSALLALELLRVEIEPLYAGVEELRRLAASSEPVAADALRVLVGKVRGSVESPRRAHRILSEVADACESVAKVAHELGLHAHVSDHRELIDLRETVDKILKLLGRAVAKGTTIERDYAPDLPAVLAPRAQVAQVLISLIANALASLRRGEHVGHRLQVRLHAEPATVAVTIGHTGVGLAADELAQIFDPDARASSIPDDPSVGLELSVARSLLRSLGGDLRVATHADASDGKTFVALFVRPKACEVEAVAPSRPTRPPPARERQRSVLVLEPDAPVRSALSQLIGQRYDVLMADQGREARRLLLSGAKPDVVLVASDDSDGRKFVEWLLRERPELTRRLLITTERRELVEELYGLSLLEKPLSPPAVFHGIEERLRAPLRKARAPESAPHPALSSGVARW